jgi:hypothetical protein
MEKTGGDQDDRRTYQDAPGGARDDETANMEKKTSGGSIDRTTHQDVTDGGCDDRADLDGTSGERDDRTAHQDATGGGWDDDQTADVDDFRDLQPGDLNQTIVELAGSKVRRNGRHSPV